jgi:hypothetical protein
MDNTRLLQCVSAVICAAALTGACGISLANTVPVTYQDTDDEGILVRGVFRIEDDDQVLLALADNDAEHALVIGRLIFYPT